MLIKDLNEFISIKFFPKVAQACFTKASMKVLKSSYYKSLKMYVNVPNNVSGSRLTQLLGV